MRSELFNIRLTNEERVRIQRIADQQNDVLETFGIPRAASVASFMRHALQEVFRTYDPDYQEVAPEPPSPRVYFLRSGDRVKIGFTTDLRTRMAALRCGNALEVQLLKVVPGGRAEEAALHRRFNHLRVKKRSEWFRAEPDLLDYIAMLDDGSTVE
jgi:hypothetical protein